MKDAIHDALRNVMDGVALAVLIMLRSWLESRKSQGERLGAVEDRLSKLEGKRTDPP